MRNLNKDLLWEVVDKLVENFDSVDLDTIDGAFYYLFCAEVDGAPFLDRAAELDADLVGRRADPERVPLARGTFRLAAAAGLPVNTLANFLLGTAPLRLREPAIDVVGDFGPGDDGDITTFDDHVLVKVFSGAWNGTRLADAVENHVENHPLSLHLRPVAPGVARIGIELSFVDETGHHPKYVELRISLPLPPMRAIAAIYDDLATKRHGWTFLLPGKADRKAKKTAIRTWAVGLLIASGQSLTGRFGAGALEVVSKRCPVLKLNNGKKFILDRADLCQRVPEAADCLYDRRPRRHG